MIYYSKTTVWNALRVLQQFEILQMGSIICQAAHSNHLELPTVTKRDGKHLKSEPSNLPDTFRSFQKALRGTYTSNPLVYLEHALLINFKISF